MNILIDTNIALDLSLKRPKLIDTSLKAVQAALSHGHHLYFLSSSVTDFYYILKKNKLSNDASLASIRYLATYTSFATVDEDAIIKSLDSPIKDFEDAVVDTVATNIKADIILTRNKKDFINSSNKVLTPEEFLSL